MTRSRQLCRFGSRWPYGRKRRSGRDSGVKALIYSLCTVTCPPCYRGIGLGRLKIRNNRCDILWEWMRKCCIKMRSVATLRVSTFLFVWLRHRLILNLTLIFLLVGYVANSCGVAGTSLRPGRFWERRCLRRSTAEVDENELQFRRRTVLVLKFVVFLSFSSCCWPATLAWLRFIVVAVVADIVYWELGLASRHVTLGLILSCR